MFCLSQVNFLHVIISLQFPIYIVEFLKCWRYFVYFFLGWWFVHHHSCFVLLYMCWTVVYGIFLAVYRSPPIYSFIVRVPLTNIMSLISKLAESVNSWKTGHLLHRKINHWVGLIPQSMLAYVIFVYFVWSCSYFCCFVSYQILGIPFHHLTSFLACFEGCWAVYELAKSICTSVHIKGKCTHFGETPLLSFCQSIRLNNMIDQYYPLIGSLWSNGH